MSFRLCLRAACLVAMLMPLVANAVLPRAPTALVATASGVQVKLNWMDNSSTETGFEVQRKRSSELSYTRIATVGANVTQLSDTGLSGATTYNYRVRAVNSAGGSTYASASATTGMVAPASVTAMAIPDSSNPALIYVAWSASGGASGYMLEQAMASEGPWTQVATTAGTGTSIGGLAYSTTYYYRVRAYTGTAVSDYSRVASATTLAEAGVTVGAGPRGIYLLADTVDAVADANEPYVDGIAWRVSWTTLDTGTSAPNYNFDSVDQVIENTQAIGKKLSMALMVLDTPKYVLDSASQTWRAPGISRGSKVTTPIPWDTAAMLHYQNFLQALADHPVYDAASGTMKRLADHPTLVQVNAAILGAQSVRDTAQTLTRNPNYTRDLLKKALLDSIHAWQDRFPGQFNYVAYWPLSDSVTTPALADEVLAALTGEFDGKAHPKIGFFNEALRGDSPSIQTYQPIAQMGYSILFQACGSWHLRRPCNFAASDTSPENGFTYGYANFGAVYYEIYRTDILEPSFTPVFENWHALLNPTGL